MVLLANAAEITLVSLGGTNKDRVTITVVEPLPNDLSILKMVLGQVQSLSSL